MARSNKAVKWLSVCVVMVAAAPNPGWCGEEYLARRDSITRGLGDAPAHNIAVHTIDPWPRGVRNPRINIDGERALIGAYRYKSNTVIPPRGLTTQTINAQSSTPGLSR